MSELHEVEPEPITTLPGIPASLPKNGTTHPYLIKSINILSKFQQYSVMPFSVFSIIHLSGVVIGTSIFGPQIGDDLIGLGREIYQVPIIEIGIFISAGIHVISGISINLLRKYYNYVKYGGRKSKKDENREKFQNLTTKPIKNSIDTNGNNSEEVKNIDEGLGGIGSIIGIGSRKSITSRWLGLSPLAFSGYLFLGLLIGHVYYERIVPIAVDGDSSMVDLTYVAYELQETFWKTFSGLNMLVAAGCYHMLVGWNRYLRRFTRPQRRQTYQLLLALSGLCCVGLLRVRQREVFAAAAKRFALYLQ